MSTMFKGFALAAAVAVASTPAYAGQVVAGFNSTQLTICDDCFTAAPVSMGFSANFFGTTYTQTYVSNNGYITFDSGQGTFTPTGLGAGYSGQPIIAAFFADVDTRGANGGTTKYGTGTFNGRNAFGVTYNAVGYFPSQDDKTNTFQLLMVDRSDINAGDFDIVFNYDQIKWETGSASGGTNGFGGSSASVGYNAGSNAPGTYGQLAGSLVNGALLDGGPNSLVANSNVGQAGRYIFQVRNGQVVTPPGAVPEPATWAMMIGGFGMIGASLRYRRRKTTVSFA